MGILEDHEDEEGHLQQDQQHDEKATAEQVLEAVKGSFDFHGTPFLCVFLKNRSSPQKARRTAIVESSGLFLFDLSLNELNQLHDGNDQDRKTHGNAVLHQIEVCKLEGLAEEVDLNDRGRQEQGECACTPEPLVLTLHGEDRAAQGSHVEGVEDLAHGEREEGHGGTQHFSGVGACGDGRCVVQVSQPVSADEVGGQRDHGNECALVSHGKAETACKDALLGVTGLSVHHVCLGLFHTQSQSGEAVGDQVDPQEVNGLEDGKAHQGCKEDGQHLGEVGGQEELDRLADVVVDAASLANGGDDGGKVVVGQDHVGNVLGNVGAGDAHAHADVGVLDGGSVVYAVTRHCGDLALLAPSVDDSGLVLGLNAGVNAVLLNGGLKLLVRDLVKLSTRDGLGRVGDDAELHCDSNGGVLVVTRDHDGTDACAAALVDGGLDLGTDGVDHAGQTQENQILFQELGGVVGRLFGPVTLGDRQNTQGLVGHGLVFQHDGMLLFIGHGLNPAVFIIMGAAGQDHVGAALGVLDKGAVYGVNGGHHLAARIKGGLVHTGGGLLQILLGQAQRIGEVDQSTFGGLALGLIFLVQGGVGTQGHGGGHQIGFTGVIHHGHLVLGQGAGLMTWVQPRVSTAVRRRMTAWRWDILVTPMESTTVTTVARPSGMAATARETATMKVSRITDRV